MNGITAKALWGILIIGIIAIVAMTKGMDGEIGKIAIYGIVALGLGEKAVDYYYQRMNKKAEKE